ncbi:MAG: class I SAM-dependent methyltransferase [Acidimicrobiia bacterium]
MDQKPDAVDLNELHDPTVSGVVRRPLEPVPAADRRFMTASSCHGPATECERPNVGQVRRRIDADGTHGCGSAARARGHNALVTGTSSQPPGWLRAEARRVYGVDPGGYDAGRPEYPERVYELLATRCRVGHGTQALEIGPGTGRVTRRLVDLGAAVTAVEPDPGLAEYLVTLMEGRPVNVVVSSFEDAPLVDDVFDVAVAAMSFHWVDQQAGLAKLGRVIRTGGWAALWWTVFGDPDRPDPFDDATKRLLEDEATLASPHQPKFEVDVAQRTWDLANRAGLVEAEGELIRWTVQLDPDAVRALYASMIRIRRLPLDERERLLDVIAAIAAQDFGGVVERPFVTAVYTARRPD